MCIQVIHYKNNFPAIWVVFISRLLDAVSKILSRTRIANFNLPLTGKRFKHHKKVHDPLATVFIIDFFTCTGLDRQRRANFFNQLAIRFVHADNRVFWVIRALVNFKNVLHGGYEFCSRFWDAPFFDEPRFKATPRNCVCESQPPFCLTSAVPKMGNTYSIPPFSEL